MVAQEERARGRVSGEIFELESVEVRLSVDQLYRLTEVLLPTEPG